jgi:membrane-associated protease RseP (regulator of RpoE activity)
VKIKSSGIAIMGLVLPILPAAFVEPDEKQMARKPAKQQLAIFSAGAFANILLAVIIVALLLLTLPKLSDSMLQLTGVTIVGVNNASPALLAGMQAGEVIKEIDSVQIREIDNFSSVIGSKSPGQEISILTNRSLYTVKLASKPNNSSAPYLGVSTTQSYVVKPEVSQKYGVLPRVVLWFVELFNWLFILNVGIGLFNLVPIGPIDGGRMLRIALARFFKKERAEQLFKSVSLLFLGLVLVNILFSFIK